MKRLIFPLVLLVLITAVIFVSCGKDEPATETLEETTTVEITTSSTAIKTTSTVPKQSTAIPTHSSVLEGGYTSISGLANPNSSNYSLGLPPSPLPVVTATTTTAAATTTTTAAATTTTKAPTTTTVAGGGSTPSSSSAATTSSVVGGAGDNETPVIPFIWNVLYNIFA